MSRNDIVPPESPCHHHPGGEWAKQLPSYHPHVLVPSGWNFKGYKFVKSVVANRLDRLHARAVETPLLVLFTAIVRVLLALAFVPSGLSKRSDIGLHSCQSRLRSACSSRDFSRHQGTIDSLVYAARRRCATPFAWHAPLGALLTCRSSSISCHHHCRWIWQDDPRGRSAATRQYFSPVLGLGPLAKFVALQTPTPRRHLGIFETWTLFAAATAGFVGVTFLHRAWLRHTSMLGPGMLVATGALIGLAIVWPRSPA